MCRDGSHGNSGRGSRGSRGSRPLSLQFFVASSLVEKIISKEKKKKTYQGLETQSLEPSSFVVCHP